MFNKIIIFLFFNIRKVILIKDKTLLKFNKINFITKIKSKIY